MAKKENKPVIQARLFCLRIPCTGDFQHAEMNQLLSSVWVQVVPSRWMEPLANVAIEAGMRGTAVVASRIGGLPEIVQPQETGFLVPPGDSEALAQALIALLKDINLTERIGQAARPYALKHFDMDNYINKLEGIYERLRFLEGFDSSRGSGK
jgi:glycosyltransferase involved in cell wall biosynthesis